MESTAKSNEKTEKGWEVELDAVRQYLLSNDHPFPTNHIGIVAALNGIDTEMKRRLRDTKLQQKFKTATSSSSSNSNIIYNSNNTSSTMESDYYEIDVTKINAATSSPQQRQLTNRNEFNNNNDMMTNTTMTDDWQDVTEDDVMVVTNTASDGTNQNHDGPTTATENASAARDDDMTKITKDVVTTLASHNVVCSSPVSALAVVLHIILVQYSNVVCTGVPDDDDSASRGGFAPPIRDLPVGQLLPLRWEDHVTTTGKIQFRYRKVGYGTIVLSVVKEDSTEPSIRITLKSTNNNEVKDPLCITISEHINLLSWETAKKSSHVTKIPPVLHYKGLAIFLRTFMENVNVSNSFESNVPSNDHFASHYANAGAIKDIPAPTTFRPTLSSSGNPISMTTSPDQDVVVTATVPVRVVEINSKAVHCMVNLMVIYIPVVFLQYTPITIILSLGISWDQIIQYSMLVGMMMTMILVLLVVTT
jgi:hypothetical protein